MARPRRLVQHVGHTTKRTAGDDHTAGAVLLLPLESALLSLLLLLERAGCNVCSYAHMC